MKPLLDCRALARLLSQSQDHAPPLVVRARMRLHLVTCDDCRTADEQLRFIRDAMKKLSRHAPSDMPARMKQA